MKKFFLLTVILAFFGLTANAQPKNLLGTWKSTIADVYAGTEYLMSKNCSAMGMEMSFTFKNGEECLLTIVAEGESETYNVTYKVVGTVVILTDQSGEDIPLIYKDGKLWMERQEEDGMLIRLNFEKK